MTAWALSVRQPRFPSDDWSGVTTRVTYDIDPAVFYRARLTLLTPYADLAAQYERGAGLTLGGGAGSLLDLALAAPALLPALAPLTLRYQRLRFEQGWVALSNSGALRERQAFRTQLDEGEARWRTLDAPRGALWVTARYQSRAMPRQIYLTEEVTTGVDEQGNETSSGVYYDVSEQLLWTPTATLELGVQAALRPAESLEVTLGLGVGGGGYELRTPLGGALLDEGRLASLSFNVGAELCFPLSELLALKVAYDLQGQALSPMGLPAGLERALSAEAGADLEGLSLSFHTVDLLSRLWLSLALTL
ncbi:MAG: hypothetical protein FJ138_16615 [Deltaproteobacteria bacterium]|nr:hypothetical protein [Deltaproteobacteria bacterium]